MANKIVSTYAYVCMYVATIRIVKHGDQQILDVGFVQRQRSLVRVERGVGDEGSIGLHLDGALFLVVVRGEDVEPARVADVLGEVVHQAGGGPAHLTNKHIVQLGREWSDYTAALVIGEIKGHVGSDSGEVDGHRSGRLSVGAEIWRLNDASHTGPEISLDQELLRTNRNVPIVVALPDKVEVANISIFVAIGVSVPGITWSGSHTRIVDCKDRTSKRVKFSHTEGVSGDFYHFVSVHRYKVIGTEIFVRSDVAPWKATEVPRNSGRWISYYTYFSIKAVSRVYGMISTVAVWRAVGPSIEGKAPVEHDHVNTIVVDRQTIKFVVQKDCVRQVCIRNSPSSLFGLVQVPTPKGDWGPIRRRR